MKFIESVTFTLFENLKNVKEYIVTQTGIFKENADSFVFEKFMKKRQWSKYSKNSNISDQYTGLTDCLVFCKALFPRFRNPRIK